MLNELQGCSHIVLLRQTCILPVYSRFDKFYERTNKLDTLKMIMAILPHAPQTSNCTVCSQPGGTVILNATEKGCLTPQLWILYINGIHLQHSDKVAVLFSSYLSKSINYIVYYTYTNQMKDQCFHSFKQIT